MAIINGTDKIKDSYNNLNTAIETLQTNVAGWRVYNDISDLGLTAGSETMEAICAAMANRSELRFQKFTSNTSNAYPANAGALLVRRYSANRIELHFLNGGNSGLAREWIGYYDPNITPNFTGWSELAKTSDLLTYETGTWTPVLAFGGSSTGITYADRFGRYTRIGNKVFYEVEILLSSKGSATGDAAITGLPFTSSSSRPYSNIVGAVSSITLPSNVTGVALYIPTTVTAIFLRQVGNNIGLTAAFNDTHFGNSTTIRAAGMYTI